MNKNTKLTSEDLKIIEKIESGELFVNDIDENYLSNKDFIKAICYIDPHNFGYVENSLLKDREFVLEILDIGGYAYQYLTGDLLRDEEMFNCAARQWPEATVFASQILKDNKDLILPLLDEQPLILKYLNDDLKLDKDIIKKVFSRDDISFNDFNFLYFGNIVITDKEIALLLLKRGLNVFSNLSEDLRDDIDVWKNAINKKNGMIIQNAGPNISGDKNLILDLLEKDYRNIKYINNEFKEDEDVWSKIVKFGGLIELALAPSNILESKRILLEVIKFSEKSNNIYLHKFSKDLIIDDDIINSLLTYKKYADLIFIPKNYYNNNNNTEKILKVLEGESINKEIKTNLLKVIIPNNDLLSKEYYKLIKNDKGGDRHMYHLESLIYSNENFLSNLINMFNSELMKLDVINLNSVKSKKIKF